MLRNIGTPDRIIRIVIAVIFTILYATEILSGQWGIAILVIAVVMLLTAGVGFCPLYSLFGVNTCKKVH